MNEVLDTIVIGGGQAMKFPSEPNGYPQREEAIRYFSGQYKERVAAGKPDQQPMFTSFYADGVVWPNGTKESVDTVIYATDYRPHLPYLQAMRTLGAEGRPLHKAGISVVPGLYYVGLEGQRSFASATLRGVGPDVNFVMQKLTSS